MVTMHASKRSKASLITNTIMCLLLCPLIQATIAQKQELHPSLEFLKNEWLSSSNDNKEEEQNERKTSKFQYSLLDSEGLFIAMHSLAKTYPNLVTLHTAQEVYGLPSVGGESDCTFEETKGCNMWILTIEDKFAYPDESESSKKLPEVFLSGAVHGSERVGPTAVVITASLLLESAHCEALPVGQAPTAEDDGEIWDKWEEQITQARYCRRDLKKRGISDVDRKWLARLVTTRRIVIVPTANALGFYRHLDYENFMSPKRDFPFDITNSTDCFKTITARTINELFRTHMFQVSLSFHGGKLSATYPYGSLSYLHKSPPDDVSMDQITDALSVYGGGFKWNKDRYPTGQSSDLVGPTHGRFEDWSYAASWTTTTSSVQCTPTTYGGYDAAKSTYDDSMLRSVSLLIETSMDDNPPESHLGNDHHVFDPKSSGSGHIPRNIRAILMSIDVVQPYAVITLVNHLTIQDDIVPLSNRDDRNCKRTKIVSIPEGMDHVTMEWDVGGAITVDDTSLWYAKWSDLPPGFDGSSQPSADAIATFYTEEEDSIGQISPGGKGKTRWYRQETSSFKSTHVKGPTFRASVKTNKFKDGDEIAVFAVVEADKSWETQPSDIEPPNMAPQSHLVNARTNPSWYKLNTINGKSVQGRRQFFSIPVTLKISSPRSVTEEQSLRIHEYARTKLQTIERDSVGVLAVLIAITILAYAGYIGKKYFLKRKEKKKELVYSNILEESEKLDTFELT